MQYTHVRGNPRKLRKVLDRKKTEVNKLDFTLHRENPGVFILESSKQNVKGVKALVDVIGTSLGEWSIIHYFGSGITHSLKMSNKDIVFEGAMIP